MKLSEGNLEEIKKMWGDWEATHAYFDDLMRARMEELDPEFLESMDKAFDGSLFWYA